MITIIFILSFLVFFISLIAIISFDHDKISKTGKICAIILFASELTILGYSTIQMHNDLQKKREEISFMLNIPEFYSKDARSGLKDALKYYDIKDPEIVYAMARLETGNFNSRLCLEDNNILGLYDSRNKCFYQFDHWVDCVIAYKELVEYKRTKDEDMYTFLKRITYAVDSNYVNKLKELLPKQI